MSKRTFMSAFAAVILAATGGAFAHQGGHHMTRGHRHDSHADGVSKRGDGLMGFDHRKTTHRFTLLPDGGTIEVAAKEAGDKASRDRIRRHLAHIAKVFAGGNFKAPMLIHDQVPPGVPVMERLKGEIKYEYGETELGARVRVRTTNGEALRAVHEFLRFQIEDHRTGDATEVREQSR